MKRIVLLGFLLISTAVWSSEGVFEINQACAAVGCFPGDTAGLPVTITQSGAYRLTSNLNVPTTHGISVTAEGVQLDLGGFTISGPVVCSGSPIACTPSSYGPTSVLVSGVTNGVVVRNGRVQGFGPGIFSGPNGVIENIVSIGNAATGIVVGDGAIVRNSSAIYNGTTGIATGLGSQVIDSVASFNKQYGIAVGRNGDNGGSVIRNTSVILNTGTGIYDAGRSIIEGCLINGNTDRGIQINQGGSQLIDNIITKNGAGVYVDSSGLYEPGGVASTFSGNTLTGNNGGSANAQLEGNGVKVFLTPNLCGTVICS